MQVGKCPSCGCGLVEQAAFCARCGDPLPDAPAYDQIDYAAFISYRHRSPDREVAAKLHRAIERYRLPRSVAAEYGSRTLGRVFRDQDELPATGSLPTTISEALKRSGALVVVCSPETAESEWVAQEIELFCAYHGRDRVFAALAKGPSKRSIPPVLRERLIIGPDGQQAVVDVEPLAADLRSDGTSRFDTEKLRIIAALAGCSFDDLRQRDKSRRMRRAVGIAVAAFAAIALVVGMVLFSSRIVGQHRDEALVAESQQLAAESQQLLARGDRYEAIETALSALPQSSSDTSRPLVAEAKQALEDALQVHDDRSAFWRPSYSLSTEHSLGLIDNACMTHAPDELPAGAGTIAFCPLGDYFAVSDGAGAIATYELSTGRMLASCQMPEAAGATDVPDAGESAGSSGQARLESDRAGAPSGSPEDESTSRSVFGDVGIVGAEAPSGDSMEATGQPGFYVRKAIALPDRLVVANASGEGALAGFEPRTGNVVWSHEKVSVAALSQIGDSSLLDIAEFDPRGNALIACIDATTGEVMGSRFYEKTPLTSIERGVCSAAGPLPNEFYVALGNTLARMDLTEGSIQTVGLAYPEMAMLHYDDGVLIAGTVGAYDGEEVELEYAIEAFDVSQGKLEPKWRHDGKLASEMLESAGLVTLVPAWPQLHGFTTYDGGVVASAGRNVYVFDRDTGEEVYEHGFASTVLDAFVLGSDDDEANRLFIMCVDGTIVIENPESPTRNYDGDAFRLQLGSPIRWGKFMRGENSYQFAAASAAADDRLVVFDTGSLQSRGNDRDYGLDELLELAHAELERAGR